MPIDLEKSKRDMPDPAGPEMEANYRNMIHKIGLDMEEAQKLALAMGLDDQYGKVASQGIARFIQLFERSSQVPFTAENLSFHAEVRGRMSEVLRLTLGQESLRMRIDDLEVKQNRFKTWLAQILKKRMENDG